MQDYEVVDPHRRQPIAPHWMFEGLRRHRQLTLQMVKREVVGRYRGSMMGMAWSLFYPLLMLSVYTFVFTVVFNARWGSSVDKGDFAALVFVGLVVHGVFAECLTKAPGLIVANANYVKKVVFPLDILAWVLAGSALFHGAVSLLILLAAQVLFASVPWTAMLFPFVLLPLVFACIGLSWFLSAAGVYLRDISHVTGVASSLLLFMSPVFYPADALPEQFRFWLGINPLTYFIEESRAVLIFGRLPQGDAWLVAMAAGLLTAWGGFVWFQRTRRGFADVM
ncbi:MAG: lipopolysaccharide transport system permease protein [Azoarcus sp.]|nr:lipopolysaccharide transport system permease protein [Azoarcus sp.]